MKTVKTPFYIIFSVVLTFCFGGSLTLYPRKKQPSDCKASPKLKSYNIKKIAVLTFTPSKKTEKEDYVPPYATRKHKPIPKYIHLNNDGMIAANTMEKELISTFLFKIVDRRTINKVLEELEFQDSDLVDDKNRTKIGKLTGADAIITGTVNRALVALQWQSYGDIVYAAYIGYVDLQMRLIDIKTGEVLWICNIQRNSLNYVDEALTISASRKETMKSIQKIHGPSDSEIIIYVMKMAIKEGLEPIIANLK